jgi:omega-6 fatty acid desaturase (delta-12 desaturase)
VRHCPGALFVTPLLQLKAAKRALIERHVRASDGRGAVEVACTLVPMALLWWAVAECAATAPWLLPLPVAGLTLLLLRAFVLMHECGHGSLFASHPLNRLTGFVMGVLTGMPQGVWSVRHSFHHATNGNWAKYRGPLNTLSVDDYAALTPQQQLRYARQRHIRMAPLAGFLYVVFNPRFNWLRGSGALLVHVLRGRRAQPGLGVRALAQSFASPYWASAREYRHMTANNLALLAMCGAMSLALGPALYLSCALISMSLAGAAGIVLFTVQHNFDQAYASGNEGWDYDQAALEGTSFLVLPAWLNWVTADIGYHHIHHLSARIPCYRLAACHREHQALFASVQRLRLMDIPTSLRCILWDAQARRITSVAAYERRLAPSGPVAPPAPINPGQIKSA